MYKEWKPEVSAQDSQRTQWTWTQPVVTEVFKGLKAPAASKRFLLENCIQFTSVTSIQRTLQAQPWSYFLQKTDDRTRYHMKRAIVL